MGKIGRIYLITTWFYLGGYFWEITMSFFGVKNDLVIDLVIEMYAGGGSSWVIQSLEVYVKSNC